MNRRTFPSGIAQKFWIGTLTTLVSITAGLALYKRLSPLRAKAAEHSAMRAVKASSGQMTAVGFGPTVPNVSPAPEKAPDGMVWIPGGEFSMGAQEAPGMNDVGMKATIDSRPVHRVFVDGFFMDKTDVTNAQFEKFVKTTGYITVAERKPRAEDYPGAPPENLVAGSVVFAAPDHPVPLNDYLQWWTYVPGASWRHPVGPKSSIVGNEVAK